MNSAALHAIGMTSSTCPVTRGKSSNVARIFGANLSISYNQRSADYGCDTTAIVFAGRVFFVLNGNHAVALCALAEEQGVPGCVEYFVKHIGQANRFSDHLMATGLVGDPFGLVPTALDVIGSDGVDRIAAAVRALAASASNREH